MTLKLNNATVNDVYLNRNIGYTIVGNPTITDGVVSGITSSDRLRLGSSISFTNIQNVEFNVNFTTGNSIETEWLFGYLVSSTWCGIYTSANGVQIPFTRYDNTTRFCSVQYSLQTQTTYTINVKRVSGNVTSTLLNSSGTVFATNTANIPYDATSSNNTIGTNPSYSYGGAFSGSINLNKTFIKIGGITFFNGKQQASPAVNTLQINGNAVWTRGT